MADVKETAILQMLADDDEGVSADPTVIAENTGIIIPNRSTQVKGASRLPLPPSQIVHDGGDADSRMFDVSTPDSALSYDITGQVSMANVSEWDRIPTSPTAHC